PNGKLSGFVSLGGKTSGDPVVARNQDGRLEVFVIGTDGGVWHTWQLKAGGGSWFDWYAHGAPAGVTLAAARVITRRDGRMVVIARGAQDGAVYLSEQTTPNGLWTGWSSLGGAIEGAPAIGNNQDGRLEIFGRGTDGALWHAWENGVGAGFS